VEAESTKQVSVTLFLACFGWNLGPPRVILARLDNVGCAARMLLELKLRQIRFEGCLSAEVLIRDVFGAKLWKEVISTGLEPVRYFKDSEMGAKPALSVRVDLRQELLPDICVNPAMILDVS
jgi:hypothetical protein